ncbi:hypothetical protein GALL_37760 [mine drainage metagenome]|uniref:Uncharacterized protein n=1 Tax=mine drainage metagenome TaxID=410659 RepID=A0A1J5TTQ4_9ZZZZ
MSNVEIIQFIIDGVIILFLGYVAFLKSYFQEKGKNLATKEDIEEITSSVEAIKSSFQYSLQTKLSWRAEEHDALVDYYSKFGAWISTIMGVNLAGITYENAERLAEITSVLDDLERQLNAAGSRLELFVSNNDILLQKGPLIIRTLGLQHHAQNVTLEFEGVFLEIEQMKLNTPIDKQIELYIQFLDKQKTIYKKFKDQQLSDYQELLPLVVAHRNTISAHLRKLIGE